MSRVVRSSKYRHVFGTVFKKENCFDDVRVSRSAWDTDIAVANPKYVSVIIEAAGGGSFSVLPWGAFSNGKVPPSYPLVTGHKQAVLDLDFNPFNDNLVASASEDGTIKIWGIPEGGLTSNLTEALQTLVGHKRKVGTIKFNPVANNILASSSTDFAVKIWDIEKGDCKFSIDAQHSDIINSTDWNADGSLLVSACKDKKMRILDPRQSKVAADTESHGGTKPFRAIWIGNKLFSVGFSKTSEREYNLYDPRDISKKLVTQIIDSASGSIMPFFDGDTGILYLAGKGDGNIRYYELVDEAPYLYFLSEFKSNTPQRGMCSVPKRALNVSECEVARLVKVGVSKLEPISFCVPRKSEVFQDDIYPDCYAGEPALQSADWCAGKNANAITRSLAPGFVPKEKPANEFKPEKKEEKVLSEKELRDEVDKLTNRVAYLEAELIKRDARIKELEK